MSTIPAVMMMQMVLAVAMILTVLMWPRLQRRPAPALARASRRAPARALRSERGVSLVESVVALGVISVGLLGLAGMFAVGLTQLGSSQGDLVAREKASEAVESVFSARDTRVLTWAQLQNIAGAGGAGGVFRDGAQQLREPGADGLVNTADDGPVQKMATPGPDNILGTADDQLTALNGFTREIEIRNVAGSTTLRQIRVVVTYRAGGGTRQFVLTTLMSSFS